LVTEEVVMMMFGFGSHWAIWQVALMWVWMTAFGGLLIGAAFALVKSGTADRREGGTR
jgi:membrane associated rhomboid family serine protease